MSEQNFHDVDPAETKEWLDALEGLIAQDSPERAQFIVEQLLAHPKLSLSAQSGSNTPYCNTITPENETIMPDDGGVAKRVSALIRWNALAMVLRGGKRDSSLGGHIASYASSAILYEVGFNYFFKAPTAENPGDLVFVQGHCAPGIYARAFLEGRLSESKLDRFRQEALAPGLPSYPHPYLMPDFWQFPTVSMGLGPMQAIYQARFLKYLHNRGLADTSQRRVWAFLGDGETDEPESLGALSIAAREGLDNLTFVINCNLQRLDGPVRGNGSIVQELESIFHGAGWNVIKLLWGKKWDPLFAKDQTGILLKRMHECVDGEYQAYKARDGAYVRQHFFGKYPELEALVADMSDDDIWRLGRGGHDPQKVYAAYHQASHHQGQPTVILAKTVKGYGMGAAGEAQNITHQQKKMELEHIRAFRDRFQIPIEDKDLESVPYYRPADGSEEAKFLRDTRAKLGGAFPVRKVVSNPLDVPKLEAFKLLLEASGEREFSTTMAMVRLMNILLKNNALKDRIIPIVPDECRTFGMEGMFRQFGIYSPKGQLYTPEDSDQLMFYREATDGQILEEGINEAGGFCSWMAAGTSYQVSQLPLIPFYIYYSMFGFQRIGDLAWAAGDAMARGFLVGGTAGRTTLAGEGLQHNDGHSHILAGTIPNCISYDPAFGYELAVIVQHGLQEMYVKERNVYFYLTVTNEKYTHPAMPDSVEKGIIKGMYHLKNVGKKNQPKVQLLGSGTILREVLAAADYLNEHCGVSSDVWSVTSFNELKREAMSVERHNRIHYTKAPRQSYVSKLLYEREGPVIAATDYMRSYADQIRSEILGPYVVLGTDGFGRSDGRSELRRFFEVDSHAVVMAALKSLVDEKTIDVNVLQKAIKQMDITPSSSDPFAT